MNDKIIFNQSENPKDSKEPTDFVAKQEFTDITDADVRLDPEDLTGESSLGQEGELLTENLTESLTPKPRWWKKLLILTAVLFFGATVAQSVQWLIDTWQQQQWIYFVFALVSLFVVILGFSALFREWRRLAILRRHIDLQRQSETLLQKSAVDFEQDLPAQDSESGKQLCLKIAESMNLEPQHPALNQWQKQINESYSAQEVAYLFSQTLLKPIDAKAIKLVTKSAVEAGIIVAISPLALVDMFFIAWRNIRLVNRIARLYGIELGYASRLRLIRLVLLNVAFAGATELAQEIGMDWLSQDIAAKLSARAAQGIGVGLLTARLGIKAMEFCRPLVFSKQEKPKLTAIHRELLSTLKSRVFTSSKIKDKEKM